MKNFLFVLILMITYTIDPYIIIHSFYQILKPKFQKKEYYILAFLGFYLLIVIKQIMVFQKKTILTTIMFPVMFSYILPVIHFMYQNNLRKKLILFVEDYMLAFFADSIVSAFLIGIVHFPSNTFTTFGCLNVFAVVIARLLNLFLYKFIFLKIREKPFHYDIKNRYVVILICNFIIIIPIIIGFYVVQSLSPRLSWISMLSGILMISEIIFCLIISWESNSDKKKVEDATAQVKLMEMQMEYSESITEMSQEMRKLRHDFNNHLSTIIQLLEHSQIKEAVSYIKQLNCVVENAMDVCVIDNPILRAVVTEKKRKARRNHIPCTTLISVSQFPLNNLELNSLFSNILDNAIEANAKVDQEEKRKIDMEITGDQENIYIECINSLAGQPISDKKKGILTSKEDKSKHGMGLKIVEGIIQKYHGSLNIFYDNETFKMSISLPHCEGTK